MERPGMDLFRVLVIGVFILAIPVALLTTNVRLAFSEKAVYDYAVRNYGAEEASGIAESELIRANGQIREYLVNSQPGLLSITVKDSEGREKQLFNVRETAHMADVRDLVGALFSVQIAALALLLALAVVMLVMWPPRALAAAALYGSVLAAGLLGLASLIALSGFDSAWTQFHVVAFRNDFWLLNPNEDHLIQMFPEAFWFDITMLIGIVTLLQATVIAGISAAYLLITRPREEKRAVPEPRDLPPPDAGTRPRISPPDPGRYAH
jgi:integral membrane protein (TIGR01906 family)